MRLLVVPLDGAPPLSRQVSWPLEIVHAALLVLGAAWFARMVATAPALVPLQLRGQQPEAMATHVVYRGRALALTPAGIVLGRDAGESALQLPEGVAGLSRRHCTLRREGGRSQIIDHSSHGSWLNGSRVHGRALLPAGSTLRLGRPGVELQLVALEGG